MPKKITKDSKKEVSNSINAILETDIDWTKLSNVDLGKVVQLVNHMDEIAMRVAKRKAKDWAQRKASDLVDLAAEYAFK
ncbi:MAG: hypothetical protein UY48_C0011G0011 [Candidatus Gottesmanbacteria bacterium GW2011_GWB1_49_7]|uniref:Uncharacterized protein n=1 Tax=Candidatus Gottesmanbacteria bacterium GW2011_GWB1_49_7 TaxID=1618448 RepID=A0A0G1Z1I5_9BACT|nr:MAG: hypothetical protein UY48_C0011G0011 [Candidatus Gottesmanbacteria bacterium GW2011_GWB1_49_7]